MHQADRQPSRRTFLHTTGTVVAAGLAAGCTADSARPDRQPPPPWPRPRRFR
ncbi:twin-arginine translocation signal domain-containing protein [Streptomyces albulus]|nr:twin-arginine translocation signal domain-containing protein [Streptomyces noursei]